MEKQKLLEFVNKYSLAGLIESVKLEIKDNTLSTAFVSSDRSVIGNVEMKNFTNKDAAFGVYDTNKLKSMLSVLESTVDFSILEMGGKSVAIKIKDDSTTVNYMLADLSVIPNVPSSKNLPDFDINIPLNLAFITRFIKAKSALSDDNNFTFVHKNGVSKIILGYSDINTNRIDIEVDSNCTQDVDPISFSSSALKEILMANKEASDMFLNISTKGLAQIQVESGNYSCQYFLVETKV